MFSLKCDLSYPILVIVGVPEQEVPDDLGHDVEKYLWQIALDYRPQIYNFIVIYSSSASYESPI